MSKKNPYGDDAGTRIGRPSEPDRKQDSDSGNEAARGINADSKKSRGPGSEPLKDRKDEHVSGYGGKGGDPKTSSDQR